MFDSYAGATLERCRFHFSWRDEFQIISEHIRVLTRHQYRYWRVHQYFSLASRARHHRARAGLIASTSGAVSRPASEASYSILRNFADQGNVSNSALGIISADDAIGGSAEPPLWFISRSLCPVRYVGYRFYFITQTSAEEGRHWLLPNLEADDDHRSSGWPRQQNGSMFRGIDADISDRAFSAISSPLLFHRLDTCVTVDIGLIAQLKSFHHRLLFSTLEEPALHFRYGDGRL